LRAPGASAHARIGDKNLATAVLRQSARADVTGSFSVPAGNPRILRVIRSAALALHPPLCRSARRAVIPRTLPMEGWNVYAESGTHAGRDAALR